MAEDILRLARLNKPEGPVDVVLDTDTFNEVDDQFALSYLVKSDDELNLKAIYAAPFYNYRVQSPAEGVEKSHQEIFNVLTLLKREDLKSVVYKGSDKFLPDEKTPVYSDAAKHLAELAMHYTEEKPLYVIAIAAITNVASAILLNPEIASRIVVIWLGGQALEWPNNREFNCYQDVAAARVVFGSGVALVQVPCMGVVSAFTTTRQELEYWIKGKNELCDYLCKMFLVEATEMKRGKCASKPIWDVTAIAWLLKGKFMDDRLEHTPIPEYDDKWGFDRNRPLMRYVYHIHRDNLMEDLFTKLAK